MADLYLRIADRYTGIRRIEVCANRVAPESYVQYSLFDDPKQTDKERHLQEAVLNVKLALWKECDHAWIQSAGVFHL